MKEQRDGMKNTINDEEIRKYLEGVELDESVDIAKSLQGYWYFIRYDKECNIYNSIYKFITLDELKKILLIEFAEDVNIVIENIAEGITMGNCTYADRKLSYDEVQELAGNLSIIKEQLLKLNDIERMLKLIK